MASGQGPMQRHGAWVRHTAAVPVRWQYVSIRCQSGASQVPVCVDQAPVRCWLHAK
jgi:hypothetical protein